MPIRFATWLSADAGTLSDAPERAAAAELKVLTTGAMKQVVLAVVPQFEKQGHKLIVDNDTAGAFSKRIEGGETFDIAVSRPARLDELIEQREDHSRRAGQSGARRHRRGGEGRRAQARHRHGRGVQAARCSMPSPSPISTRRAAGRAASISIGLLGKLGIADAIKPKAKLKRGGLVAEFVTSGEAELGRRTDQRDRCR